MPTTDHRAAYEESLVTYLTGAVAGATVRRGFPPRGTELDPTTPLIAVTTGAPDVLRMTPRKVDEVVVSGADMTYTWKYAISEFPVQVDIWTAYRGKRDEFAALLEAAMLNDMPRTPALLLTSPNYHGRPSTTRGSSADIPPDEQASQQGLWRASWVGDVITDLVIESAGTTIASIVQELSITHANAIIIEPDRTVT